MRALRVLFLIQLVYQKSEGMKLIFEAFVKCLPFYFTLVNTITFLFIWVGIVMVKVYKDDEYYCGNASMVANTKEECFEWGGDWVKYTLNYSSVFSAMF